MKKRPKQWVFTEMILMFVGLILAIYNGKVWGSPTILFSIFMVIFIYRTIERKVFKHKTEFWLNLVMAGIFLVLAMIPLMQ